MLVIFSHGKESGPWGTKIRQLAETAKALGHEVESLDYQDTMDPDQRAERLLSRLRKLTSTGVSAKDIVLVGSSMGGYVTLQAAAKVDVAGSFLLAPAIYMPGYEAKAPRHQLPNLTIVHGWQDDIIPVEHSLRFAQAQQAELHLLNDDHRLVTHLSRVNAWFAEYLQRFTA